MGREGWREQATYSRSRCTARSWSTCIALLSLGALSARGASCARKSARALPGGGRAGHGMLAA